MGQYIGKPDFLDVYGEDELVQLTDRAGVGAVDEAVLAAAIAAAEGDFESYAARRHQVPVDLSASPGVAETVQAKILDLAVYYLYARGRRGRVPEDVRRSYEDALKWLRDLARGDVTLGATPGPAESGPDDEARTGGDDRRFTRDTLRGF